MQLSSSAKVFIADLSLVLVALFWGLGFVAMKDALEAFPTFWLLTLRFFTAALIMALLFRRTLAAASKRDLGAGALIGVFLFLGFAAQTIGLNYTSPGKQAFLTATYVVLVPLISWGVRRIFPGVVSLAASGLCLAGMALLTLQEGFSINSGDSLTLLCAIFFAVHILAIERFAATTNPLVLAVVQIFMVGLLSLPFAVALGPWPGLAGGGSAIWSLVFTIFFCTIFAFIVQNAAQKFTPSTHTAIILSLESVFGAAAGIYFYGEVFTSKMALGCALILASVLLTETGRSLARVFSYLFPAAEKS